MYMLTPFSYTASKHGLLGLTKNTGVYYGPRGIRCNAILAGSMNTNIASALRNGINIEGLATMRRSCQCGNSIVEAPWMMFTDQAR